MSKVQFVIGQRWISEAEVDLGLGIVLDVANRRLTLSFPAAGERRTYALDNAPVSRVKYEVGETVRHQDGTRIKITKIVEQAGCLMYVGLTKDQEEFAIPEFELDSFVQFSTPRERLFAGQIDKHEHFFLRYQTLHYQHQHRHSPYFGLAGPRVQLLPHQLYIAGEVAQRHAPRVLLADEVGLGKTIEAGLVLHQQLLSGRIKRALIVVPASLQHQWLVEMLRRFNLSFTLLDEARCNALVGLDSQEESVDYVDDFEDDTEHRANSENPFESAQLVLCSLDFLTDNPVRYQQAVAAGWDLLLVDEAHHLQWSPGHVSAAYACIEGLARVARGLLLLTATPEQLGLESHFARLRLLDPDRYYDLDAFKAEQQSYKPLNDLVQDLLQARDADAGTLSDSQVGALKGYLPVGTLVQLKQQIASDSFASAVDTAITCLLDRHGTGRVLFRNTRNSVSGFPGRQLHGYALDLGDDEQAFVDQPLVAQIRAETFWHSKTQADWWLQDGRVTWLADWLKQNKRKKVLVICASADTAQTLEEYLRLRKGILTSVFHEHMSLIERDRSAAYFADLEEGAQVLICSEIGSEGRNFQFAQDLVLFDLPINPDLLEQRIGRLDRIGQTGTVNIHVPFFRGTAQARLLDWYHQGLNAFEKTCAIGQAVYSRFADELLPALVGQEPQVFEALLSTTRAHAQALLEQLQQGRDRLLELNSCKPQQAQQLVDALADNDQHPALANYMESVFDCFGIDMDRHSEHSLVLHPSDHMRIEQFPGLPESGLTITYQRQQALSREDMQFLTWEHPLVRGAQDLIVLSEFGNTAFCTLKLPPLKPGNLLVEALFVLHCPAPAELQLSRFIPQSVIRVLLDDKGKDLSAVLNVAQLSRLVQKVPRNNAQELVRHARPQLTEIIHKAEQVTQANQAGLIENAKAAVATHLNTEIDRLKALAEVNPNVRQEEIQYLQERLAASQHFLGLAKVRLDSLRVVMTI
ncbi:RNA polymerase-associated protein RapA [Cellvibrio japonicus]|uniref:RNA polymerase-associated protein RapA n=1 Tax=Cellvibrio japonicus (strain Ueda107) TaxID=498211 RepID=B3PHI1_CELJU|nr:RNA polymerase-associated protein RapA [Cellvibrio japonicus]ACE85403.1 RNA polymerase-associated protein HepA [Cellvibrio japonicus Ueda107]QEI12459.1 RNA polymerase-associated protein RapA [Cellvibrio japonicus]QEI16033.1 RNA polymerase-associated protein RapA [Cellvibrio japonicus]QEI19611.1 RNA polymerase-associated protein RapA [Cellvibrio japonicus]